MLQRCIDALDTAGGLDGIVVVDNGSRSTPAASDGYGPATDVVVTDNDGFGAAANTGSATLAARTADYVAVLNDDVVVTAGWLDPVLAAFDEADIGAVQPKLLLDGYDPAVVNSVGVAIDRFGAGHDIGHGALDGPAFSEGRDIEVFTGGAVMFRRAFLDDLIGFDERYFLYYEDVDLALRGAARGWRYRCEPSSVVSHSASSSTGALGDRRRFYQERNRLWVAFRFGSADAIGRALGLSVRRLRHRPRRTHVAALMAGLRGAPSALVRRLRAGKVVR